MKLKSKVSRVLILILLLGATFLVTNLPNFHFDAYFGLPSSPLMDIIIHGGYYFVITFPTFLLLQNFIPGNRLAIVLLGIPAIFEFTQAVVPGRSVSTHDLIGNYVGISLALLVCFSVKHLLKRRTMNVLGSAQGSLFKSPIYQKDKGK